MNKAEDGETMMMIVNAVTGARTVSSLSILSICITLSIHTIHTYRKLGSYPIWKRFLGVSPKFGSHRVSFENQKKNILKPKSVGTMPSFLKVCHISLILWLLLLSLEQEQKHPYVFILDYYN